MNKNQLVTLIENLEIDENIVLQGYLMDSKAYPYQIGIMKQEVFGADHILFGAYGGGDTKIYCTEFVSNEEIVSELLKYIEREELKLELIEDVTEQLV